MAPGAYAAASQPVAVPGNFSRAQDEAPEHDVPPVRTRSV
jgi:hypothetical protein